MLKLCYTLFAIGVAAYLAALVYFGSTTGEELFFVGTGVLMTDAVILLLRAESRTAA